jgi:hypothetical protein
MAGKSSVAIHIKTLETRKRQIPQKDENPQNYIKNAD